MLPLGIIITLLLPLSLIWQNQYDERIINSTGGNEQNGHDFGWQFGNYQLRGVDAIKEELKPGEAPPPNPQYPPEMEPNAVFYGGTDPGRFVPTYMIYSAKVRSDVFLITQNALADNTYMNVMRDLTAIKSGSPRRRTPTARSNPMLKTSAPDAFRPMPP